MRRRRAILYALAVLLAWAGCRGARPRTNVVLISIDCMNQRQMQQAIADGTAPNLAAFARESLVFTRAYAHAPWTTPSHMSMLSGLYPSQHGRDIPVSIVGTGGRLGERVPLYETLADRLAAAGYETVAFVGKGSISGNYGLSQGFSAYFESDQKNDTKSDLLQSEPALKSWLEHRDGRPFFLFFHTYDLHYPLPESRKTEAAAIRYIDEFFGRVLSHLRAAGEYDATLVFVTGDHGSSMIHTENKCCVHGAGHYEENLRVPLLLKLPAQGMTGRRGELVRHVDLLPTALDALGMPRGSYAGPGSSILKRLGAGGDGVVSFSEADARCALRQAIVTRRYKYIYTPQNPLQQFLSRAFPFRDGLCRPRPACEKPPAEELYDLAHDPFEQHNLLDDALSPETREALPELRAELDRHRNLQPSYRLASLTSDTDQAPTPEIDESTKEALRALGYIE